MTHPEFTLTRYLYIKDDVLASLVISIFEKNYDKALFWGSELYYSELEKEVVDFVHAIYCNFFYSNNPRLKTIMDTAVERYDKGVHILATMLLNLVAKPRKITMLDFMERNITPEVLPDAYEKETKLWIFENTIESYKYSTENLEKENIPTYKLLQNVCRYECDKNWIHVFGCGYKDMKVTEIFKQHRDNWLYYASYTPIWFNRITEFEGIVDYEKQQVIFEDDENLEQFYNLYGYDLDEQPSELFQKISHTSILPQYNINDLYKKFETSKKIYKVKLKRINKVSG